MDMRRAGVVDQLAGVAPAPEVRIKHAERERRARGARALDESEDLEHRLATEHRLVHPASVTRAHSEEPRAARGTRVARTSVMHPSNLHDDVAPLAGPDHVALDGPDYVTLVIEWDDADAQTLVSQRAATRAPQWNRTLATALGALGAIALTTLGLRLLRQS
jgi:hypothetical protein